MDLVSIAMETMHRRQSPAQAATMNSATTSAAVRVIPMRFPVQDDPKHESRN